MDFSFKKLSELELKRIFHVQLLKVNDTYQNSGNDSK